jgi:hypothetical protein
MITRNLKRAAYRRAKFIDDGLLWLAVIVFGYLFVVSLLEAI